MNNFLAWKLDKRAGDGDMETAPLKPLVESNSDAEAPIKSRQSKTCYQQTAERQPIKPLQLWKKSSFL
jgi:hypothetical protein